MAFDAMARAVDWLDAYRARDIDLILKMYADDAVVDCGCDNVTVVGQEGLRAYWERRLQRYPASALDDLWPCADGAIISYKTRSGLVGAVLEFDVDGLISRLCCGPRSQ